MTIRLKLNNTLILSTVIGMLFFLAANLAPANELNRPGGITPLTALQVNEIISAHFAQRHDFKPTDLVNQGDLREILAELDRRGWKVSDANEIQQQMLPTDHPMVKAFETRKGTRFMRAVADYELIYDRMHRTAELPGGKALVRDIVKLPNGEIYAKAKPVPGNPTLTELLPKQRNGKTPKARDFDKPTGYIYTVAQLRSRLEFSRKYDQRHL